jgi:hypothetical protein
MGDILIGGSVAALLLIMFLFLLIAGVRKKRMSYVYLSLITLAVAIGAGVWTAIVFAGKAYEIVKNPDLDNPFRPRTGREIYVALFGAPESDCIQVINKKDQLVPRLDCCIWLEFRTCPSELRRIIGQESYSASVKAAADTSTYLPGYNSRPEWYNPAALADSIFFLSHIDNRSRARTLLFSKDSSHVFYCDMAD